MVFLVEFLCVEAQRAIFQLAESVAVIFVYHAGIEHFSCNAGVLCDKLEVVAVQLYLRALQKFFGKFCISPFGNALVFIVEVIVVIGKAQGQAPDNKRGQILATLSPLFFCVAFDKLFKYVPADEFQSLFLQVFGLAYVKGGYLLVYLCPCLGGSEYAPHL